MSDDKKGNLPQEFVEETLEHFKNYLEIKDKILENEYVEIFGEISKVVGFVKGVNDLITEKKFQRFLEGFDEYEQPSEEKIKKLVKYVSNEKRAEFISTTFTKVVLSNSSKSCLVMGSILNSIVSNDGPIEHQKLICINALTNFFDNDLDNFIILYEYIEEKTKLEKRKAKSIYLPSLRKYCKDNNLDYESLYLTVEKCVSTQIMSKYYLSDIDASLDIDMEQVDIDNNEIDEYHQISEPGKMLYKFMIRVL